MPRSYTTTELLASGRQKAFLANAQRDLGDVEWLRLLNEQIGSYLPKLVVKRRTNFFMRSQDLTVIPGTTASFAIPSEAMGGMARSVVMVIAGIPYGLEEMDLPVAVSTDLIPFSTQFPIGYYWENDHIRLWPTQALTGALRRRATHRPRRALRRGTVLPNRRLQRTRSHHPV